MLCRWLFHQYADAEHEKGRKGKREADNWDVVLVGPQVSHKIDFIEAVCKPKNVPFAVIDKDVYGQMDGATVLKLALVTRKKHEMGK